MAQTARLRPPRGITLYIGIRLEHRVTYNGNFGQASLYVYYRSWDRRIAVAKVVGVERLMLTPKTIREVERCLLLVDKGRAEMKLPRTVNGTGHTGPSEFCATSI